VLPNPGGVMQQNPKHVKKLLTASEAIEEYRAEEMEKESQKK
jgi:hypothetical protein